MKKRLILKKKLYVDTKFNFFFFYYFFVNFKKSYKINYDFFLKYFNFLLLKKNWNFNYVFFKLLNYFFIRVIFLKHFSVNNFYLTKQKYMLFNSFNNLLFNKIYFNGAFFFFSNFKYYFTNKDFFYKNSFKYVLLNNNYLVNKNIFCTNIFLNQMFFSIFNYLNLISQLKLLNFLLLI